MKTAADASEALATAGERLADGMLSSPGITPAMALGILGAAVDRVIEQLPEEHRAQMLRAWLAAFEDPP